MITAKDQSDLVTLLPDMLHWLSIAFRLKIKLLFMVLKIPNDLGGETPEVSCPVVNIALSPQFIWAFYFHKSKSSCHRAFVHTIAGFFSCISSHVPQHSHFLLQISR